MPTIPVICGPTASGKTSLALELAEEYPVEIVSADSRQIIKCLDIGTAKPTEEEKNKATFHLLDIIEPGARYSAFQFISDANRAIEDILNRGKWPLVVGGTGLYMRALTEGVVEIDNDDMAIRENLEKEMEKIGPEKMHEKLSNIDPLEASRVHPQNKKRVIRALEIFYLTGKTKTELLVTGAYQRSHYNFQYFCLTPDRNVLYDIINERVDKMLAEGLVEEVIGLFNKGLKEKVRKANVIGYNEIIDYLEGKLNLEEAVLLIKQNTRRYAKRQMTWFRRQAGCKYFSDREDMKKALKDLLKNNNT